MSADPAAVAAPATELQVKTKKDGLPSVVTVALPLTATVEQLKASIEELLHRQDNGIGVLARHMKLICKGKVLEDDRKALQDYGISAKSKILLMVQNTVHTGRVAPSAGSSEAVLHRRKAAASDLEAREEQLRSAPPKPKAEAQVANWEQTGLIGLPQCNLVTVPAHVWAIGERARSLYLQQNQIAQIPADISRLARLNRLNLSHNQLAFDGIDWDALLGLKDLEHLFLAHNLLHVLPAQVSNLRCLQTLALEGNRLEELPNEVGELQHLRRLTVGSNRLTALPPALGRCELLEELDASCNALTGVPPELRSCGKLLKLTLRSNRIKTIPSEVKQLVLLAAGLAHVGAECRARGSTHCRCSRSALRCSHWICIRIR
eukprot:scaffold2823_cov373-Prasinococcus_capsulatus_cf.AAC.4